MAVIFRRMSYELPGQTHPGCRVGSRNPSDVSRDRRSDPRRQNVVYDTARRLEG